MNGDLPEEFRRLFAAIRAEPAATSRTAIDIVVDALDSHDPAVRQGAAATVSDLGSANHPGVASAVEPLVDGLNDVDAGVRRRAAEALCRIGTRDPGRIAPVESALREAARDPDPEVRKYAEWSLGTGE